MSEPLFRYVGCEDGCDCASASYGACDGCGRQAYEQIPEGSRVLSAAQVEKLREIARDLKMDEWCRIEGEAIDRVLDGDRS